MHTDMHMPVTQRITICPSEYVLTSHSHLRVKHCICVCICACVCGSAKTSTNITLFKRHLYSYSYNNKIIRDLVKCKEFLFLLMDRIFQVSTHAQKRIKPFTRISIRKNLCPCGGWVLPNGSILLAYHMSRCLIYANKNRRTNVS